MIFRIPTGKHRGLPLQFHFWWNRPVFSWMVMFNESARYDLKSDDQFDTNKLIGIGYLPGHHKHSARFGWRYWVDRGEIEITAYCYIGGRRLIQHIGFVQIGIKYRLQLNVTRWAYVFDVYDLDRDITVGACSIPKMHNRKFQYRLGPYFGGNAVSPQEIKIQIEKL